jgi:hypothetical protein
VIVKGGGDGSGDGGWMEVLVVVVVVVRAVEAGRWLAVGERTREPWVRCL